MSDPRHEWGWQKLRAAVVAEARRHGLPCGICGAPIDYAASGRTPMGPTVDHVVPLAAGGDALPDPALLRITHLACNSRRSAERTNALRRARTARTGTTDVPQRPATASRW